MPLGGVLFYSADVFWLKVFVGAAILLFTLLLLFRVTLPLGSGRRIGFLSGFMTSSIGMPGPPVVLFLASMNREKGTFRATSIAYYCLVYPISLGIQFASGYFSTNLILTGILLIPAVLIGQAAGTFIHRKISQEWFVRITYVLLLATAVNVLVQSF